MPSPADNVALICPPRPVSQWGRALLAEWFAATRRQGADVARAFVSERRSDEPRIAGRIVVMMQPGKEPTHLVYSPVESACWVVATGHDWKELQRFRTLRAALNSIRPVLPMPDAAQGAEPPNALTW